MFALAEGITGYSLPDDLLSGTGARISYSAALSIPFIGPWVASLVFGGEFPTAAFIPRFFVLHVMLLPGCSSAASPSTSCWCSSRSTRSTGAG